MIIDSGAPENLWLEALGTTAYILNRIKPAGTKVSPIEKWRKDIGLRDQETSLEHLRIFYAKAYVNIPPEKRVKAYKMKARV